MRISDWSSDVCSSDLHRRKWATNAAPLPRVENDAPVKWEKRSEIFRVIFRGAVQFQRIYTERTTTHGGSNGNRDDHKCCRNGRADCSAWVVSIRLGSPSSPFGTLPPLGQLRRSEEHTSELQSLMRISYAVFCLKKKN